MKRPEPRADIGGNSRLLDLHRTMLLIRATETALSKLFADSEIPGFIHLSLGQEAVAAGVCSALAAGDTLATTHRGHGHVIARGIDLGGFFKELMGREGGQCKGRSGSMHVADMSLGILGANGIVGASVPLALGSALSHQTRRTGGIAVAFFGDGAMAEGALHEALNMAALWSLPLVFVCENNGWSEFSPTARQFRGKLAALAGAFGIRHILVDGNDAEATADAAREVADHARAAGPVVLECMTTRFRGHFEGDPQKYRDADEMSAMTAGDPIVRGRARLVELGVAASELDAMASEAEARVAAAVDAARADPLPDFDATLADVYTPLADACASPGVH
ncbi:MAG: thiamine pyrophosphate-dependent dehydrogenase E1 component subunit alpha [Pseudomonadota bacterium]